jgi:amino acid permease
MESGMTFEKGNSPYLIAFVIAGAILGSAIGTLLAGFIPQLAFIKKSLTGYIGFTLEVLSISFTLNLSAIIGLIVGLIIFRKV